MDAQLERIRDERYLSGLDERPIEDVRALRSECQAVETGLSYLRRLVQGRLDIVAGELERRAAGGDPADLGALISQLPDILSDRTRPPGPGRLPQIMAPGEVSGVLVDRLSEIVSTGSLHALAEVGDEQLVAMRGELIELEAEVSALRREVFERVDALQAELTRRYRTGEASVESLLQ
jgi:hypothetical protein